nr:uncharacterized protein LOC109744165 [Aegilops tauschii subsp. strangulata]
MNLGADLAGFAGGEQQQEEPLRAALDTPPPLTTPPRGASPSRTPTDGPTRTEEEEASLGAGGSIPATDIGGEGTTSSQLGTGKWPEDIDTIIGEVAKDVEAEATKIAAEEAAKSAAEEAAKGPAGGAGETAAGGPNKGSAGEPGKGTAGEPGEAAADEATKESTEEVVANDQPSSPAALAPGKYLMVGDDLFIRLPGTASTRAPTEGVVFDDEVLATAGLQVVDEPSAGGGGSQEEQLLRAMSANFQKLQALQHARKHNVKSRMAVVEKAEADFEESVAQTQVWFGEARDELRAAQGELEEHERKLIRKQADIEKAREVTKDLSAKDEATRQQQKALLDSQEEDLAACEQALAATLRGKDEDIEKIVAQRTQELEQTHKDALNALALDHAGKVKELELERDGMKKEVLELTEERDTTNRALAYAQAAVSDKAKLLSEANNSINDLKLKLDGLEGKRSEARAREETLNKALEDEKQLRSNDAAAQEDYVKSVNLWISRLVDVAERLTDAPPSSG